MEGMRRWLGFQVLSAAVATAAVMLVVATPSAVSASGTPHLTWSPSGTLNYGTLTPGTKSPPQVFKLTNSGSRATSPLKITLTPSSGTPSRTRPWRSRAR
jgi:hypothetical protein